MSTLLRLIDLQLQLGRIIPAEEMVSEEAEAQPHEPAVVSTPPLDPKPAPPPMESREIPPLVEDNPFLTRAAAIEGPIYSERVRLAIRQAIDWYCRRYGVERDPEARLMPHSKVKGLTAVEWKAFRKLRQAVQRKRKRLTV